MGYEVQRTWARSICSKKKPQCWGDMRAVVLGGNAQPRKDKFAEDEMLMALREGKTHLDVLLFECKRYTHDIAQDIQNWWDRREELQMLYTQGSGGQPRPVKLTKSTAKPKVASHFVPSTPGESPSPFNEPHKPRSPSKRARKRISMAGLDADDEDDDEDYCPDD
ncbi:uncharacterized protein SCHCODRAFT_02508271 [Schizophyllum commune H4-8]|uniref:Expressed protein n=1 Tax=Schizophyllum commune (strain H4-8 / FGSC 9210) TaxID=578458 RepID=D8QA25_SCHCM|nr:uncharacterized protein SCHCODRAFT_02508271 [Schizophyllum commune H4-8]KAI5890176.1 hypothetical protein SCHCODRAFT_02508271 [Schizophyllum commune H4-8]